MWESPCLALNIFEVSLASGLQAVFISLLWLPEKNLQAQPGCVMAMFWDSPKERFCVFKTSSFVKDNWIRDVQFCWVWGLIFFFVTTVFSWKMSFWWNSNCSGNLTDFDNCAWKGAGEECLERAGAPSYDIFWMERSFDLFLFLFSKWCFKMYCSMGRKLKKSRVWMKCLEKKRKLNILADPKQFFSI